VTGLKTTTVAFVAVLFVLGAADAWSSSISRERLQAMFAQMQQQSHWDLNKPLLWGYFFISPTREPLDKAAPPLAAMGYRVVGISPLGKPPSPVPDRWRPHVDRVEIHTGDSLDARNHEFNEFARVNGIALYDGMDVGPVSVGP
jgi:hypothetical protein